MLKSINNTNLLVSTSPSLSDVTTLITTSILSLDTVALRNTAISINNATQVTLSNTFTNDTNTFKSINVSGNINITTNSTNARYGYLSMANSYLTGINNTSFGSNSLLSILLVIIIQILDIMHYHQHLEIIIKQQ